MASAKLMIPKRSAPYYVLTANVTVHGKRVRRYGRFDFDPTVLKTHRQRENAAIEAALVFERAEQQKADDEKDGKNTPFRDAARAYIDSKKSMLDPSVRLEGDTNSTRIKPTPQQVRKPCCAESAKSARHLQKCRFQR